MLPQNIEVRMLVQQGMTKLYSGYVQATLASFEKTIAVGQADAPIFLFVFEKLADNRALNFPVRLLS